MAKYYGSIGYAETKENKDEPGIWEEVITERNYYGDVTRRYSRYNNPTEVNDGIDLGNNISIVADPYAVQNIQHMRYITVMGNKWKISNAEIEYPRIIITTGGLYNE